MSPKLKIKKYSNTLITHLMTNRSQGRVSLRILYGIKVGNNKVFTLLA